MGSYCHCGESTVLYEARVLFCPSACRWQHWLEVARSLFTTRGSVRINMAASSSSYCPPPRHHMDMWVHGRRPAPPPPRQCSDYRQDPRP